MTSEREVAAAVEACRSRWGRIDILHNNVGIAIAAGDAPIAELDIDVYDRMMAVNLRGMVLACRQVTPIMRAQQSGVVLTISSIGAIMNYTIGDVSDLEVRGARPHRRRHLERVLRDPGQRHPAGPPRYPDGDQRHVRDGTPRDAVLDARAAQVPLRGAAGTAEDGQRRAVPGF